MDDYFLLRRITSKERLITCYSFLIRIAPTRDSVTYASEINGLARDTLEHGGGTLVKNDASETMLESTAIGARTGEERRERRVHSQNSCQDVQKELKCSIHSGPRPTKH